MDEQEILQLLKQNEERLYRIAYSYLRNEQDALDAYQELTYRVLKNLHKLREPDYIGTWLVRVLINICLDMKKKQRNIVVSDNLTEQATVDNHTFEMSDVIAQLPIEEQELIYLKYFQDLKNKDIALRQNIPEGTVKSRLHATLKRLRILLKGDM
ncbi:sigma-70 family RNA polymerase sigma factor [Solibacillus sp. CAU 1738]|uniref:sigma-70 family RNA polymerase sigma factor n=1 Tax=Solibacillus sp. CAU 1738 TaxID=3140363 RepID=UPI0032603614